MPHGAAAAACAALGLAAALALQGCGGRITQITTPPPDTEAKEAEPKTVRERKRPRNVYLQSPADVTVPRSHGPDCQSFDREDSGATVHVLPSRAGESPTILCPTDYEYHGPRIECGWVDQLCEVQGPHETVTPELCMLQYDLTGKGQGLVTWPQGVTPRLVSTTRVPGEAVEFNGGERNAGALPAAIDREEITCRREAFVDLDFEHAKIQVAYPPYSKDAPWSKVYEGIATVGDRQVDLRVTQAQSLDAPGNVWLDGNSSATGRINVEKWGESSLRFDFVESGTLRPLVLKKFFFTVFDLDGDSQDGSASKEVGASGMAGYYTSRRTRLTVSRAEEGVFRFSGGADAGSGAAEDPPRGAGPADGVTNLWLSSLDRTVVLMFRNTANFTLVVKAVPKPNGQVLEFAGWSELVDLGTRAHTAAKGAADGGGVLGEQPDELIVSKVTSPFSQPFSAGGSDALAAGRPLRWAGTATPTAACALVVLASLVASAALLLQHRRRGCPHGEHRTVESCSAE